MTANAGAHMTALSASSAESARAADEKYAVPLTYGSAAELARSEEVDLVVVTVKVPHHLELIRPALEAGKMGFSEWPLGADLTQAEELAGLAHRRGVLTAVGAMVLGEFREVSALIENLRPEVTHVTSGAVAAKTAEDQIAVTGVLESGPWPQCTSAAARHAPPRFTGRSTARTVISSSRPTRFSGGTGGCGSTEPGERTARWPS
ncbi:Gfo/Idh/MocA family oxidoreductase [Streptomyces sp. NEAU-174]|uniref:Gfo/Idh/MocA family oxidoreductase n=1 Tax=Streptomyces sp. NEAU-174 TaxID=3458254 RepID=UPI0040440A5D